MWAYLMLARVHTHPLHRSERERGREIKGERERERDRGREREWESWREREREKALEPFSYLVIYTSFI